MIRALSTVLISVVTLGSCILPPTEDLVPDATPAAFAAALHDCRMKQPGRASRRRALPADNDGVAACLETRGWSPSGVPIVQ